MSSGKTAVDGRRRGSAGSVLRVVPMAGKGRGAVAARPLRKGEVIERAPVVIIPAREREIVEATVLWSYSFEWEGGGGSDAAIALGHSSMCNHSYAPNAFARQRGREKVIEFIALRDIAEGEEVTINYNGEPDDTDPVGFRVRG